MNTNTEWLAHQLDEAQTKIDELEDTVRHLRSIMADMKHPEPEKRKPTAEDWIATLQQDSPGYVFVAQMWCISESSAKWIWDSIHEFEKSRS